MDPKKFIAQLTTLSRHILFFRDIVLTFVAPLVLAYSFCRDIFPCSLLEFCHDVIWQCREIVLLKLYSLCHDMSVLCRDIKTLLQHNFSFSVVWEFCRDINFIFVFQLCSILRHKFEMLRHKIYYHNLLS